MQCTKIWSDCYLEQKRIRLQKYMAMCGIASRRRCEELIFSGRVEINSKIAKLGDKVCTNLDTVKLDKRVIKNPEERIYIALYKPVGYISAVSDKFDSQKCVTELVKELTIERGTRLYPVGRLDKDSEGLLLLTNDGDFANKVLHPSKKNKGHVEKKYIVTVDRKVTNLEIKKLNLPMEIDGEKLLPAKVNVISNHQNISKLKFVLYQGKNRQIRKMCAKIGLNVLKLKRISIGPVKLLNLKEGKYRELTEKELLQF